MHYLELITEQPLIWTLFLIYMVATGWLAWLGHKRTTGIESFAVGNGDMSPVVVGITLAASIASTATFVINPGFVYVHGMAALMHYGVAVVAGIVLGLVWLSPGFRRVGERVKAITLPHWVGQRFGSPAMGTFFAVVSLLSFTFMVLIVGGLAIVMQATLGLSKTESAVLIIGFVFSYVFVGGAYAHAYTNTLQGILMAIIALIIVGSGLPLLFDEPLTRMAEHGEHLVGLINPKSPLYGSFFSVWVSGFVVGFAVILQPHILTKALYVRSDAAVRKYLLVTIVVSTAFTALLLVGLYAHLADIPPQAFLDPTTGQFAQDRVMMAYITNTFSPTWTAIITVALLAAGMSTLDGLLVATSSIAGNDLFLRLAPKRWLSTRTPEQQSVLAQRAGQLVLVAMGLATLIVALDPPKLLGIFGQIGVYGLMTAASAPIFYGVVARSAPRRTIFAASFIGLALHLGLYGLGRWALDSGTNLNTALPSWGVPSFLLDTAMPQLGFLNPGVTATYGIVTSLLIGGIGVFMSRSESTETPAAQPA